ncbi:hypothetical protein F3087_14155 [Nocardia colli]|uniref:Uncharacterized protein n=1 Tax=Nocardia colli TaxID=2545717 RepID=A0A5N0EGT7_9NOCA|nr:hypothetical protein [Nocardia colli]KAA8888196.1 hypothetical protein F3087_14155 [Nocardia colli]
MNQEIIEYEDRWLLWPLRDSRGNRIEWGSDEFALSMDSGFRIVAGYGTELSPRFYRGFPDRHVITHWPKAEVEQILGAPVKATAFFKTGCVQLGFGNGWVMLTSEHYPDVPFSVYSGKDLLWRRSGMVEQTKYPVIQVNRWTGDRITAPPWPSRPADLNINYDSDDIND